MHMADALLSPGVGAAMLAASGAALLYAVRQVKESEVSQTKLPMMAISGAFIFAAQMINFTIPGTGSSGHIGGGILLAALLGGYPALLTISAVLIIQCLFFADGGLLALGCNIFNMGVIPCLLIYPLVFKVVAAGETMKRFSVAAILSVVLGLQLGAFAVVLETLASGITALPFAAFALMMQPIHFAIGLAEGIITAAVLRYVYRLRPEILTSVQARRQLGGIAMNKVLALFTVATLFTAGGLSLFASGYPDGLEWSLERVAGTAELEAAGEAFTVASAIQQFTAFMPDYDFGGDEDGSSIGTAVAGIVGAVMTFACAGFVGVCVARWKKKQKIADI